MSQVTSADGTIIAYEKSGRGPSLILVDGALGYRTHNGSRPLAAALQSTFTVIAYDRRGRGKSTDNQPYAVAREIEDIEALMATLDPPINLYGFSSGAALALNAAATLGNQLHKVAMLEPPYGQDIESEKEEFADYCRQIDDLLSEGKRAEAVTFFFSLMVPPEMIEEMKQAPDWPDKVAVAHTLAYDNRVLGDGAVPLDLAASIPVPALVLVGSESPGFKHIAAETVANAIPHGQLRTIPGHHTLVPPAVLAPILTEFFLQ